MTAPTTRRLVLVTDTDQRFAEGTRQLISDDRVLTARTVEDAAEIVVGGEVDLVLLGPSFGSEAGLGSAALLREADPGVVVVLAADIVTNRILLAALRSGVADVVDTPLTARKIAGILDRVPTRRVTPGTVLLEEAASGPTDERALTTQPGFDPVTIAFGASSSLSTAVRFVQEPDEVLEMPPHYQPATEHDGWAAPISPTEAAGVEWPPAEEPGDEVSPVVEVTPLAEVTLQPAAPGVDLIEPLHSSEDFEAPEMPASPVVIGFPSEPDLAPPPPFAPPAPPTPAAEEAPAPPDFDPKRRAPVDLERVGLLPADGRRPEYPRGSGHVVAVMSGKGGSGKTITATNLAMALTMQRGEESVVLVDADLQFGDVALLLQLEPGGTLADVISRLDELNDDRLDGMLLRHESGLRVLAAPVRPASSADLPAKAIVEVIERLRGMYEVIIVDTPPIFDDHLVTVLEGADEVLVVVDMDVPSAKNAKIVLDALRSGRFPMERVRLVVNRANAKARLDLVELERSLGLRVAASIPSDRLVPQSVNEGIPAVAMSPRSRVARAFHALAALVDLPEPNR